MTGKGAFLIIALSVPLGCAERSAPQVNAAFPATGVTTVVLRASSAAAASMRVVEQSVSVVRVSGVPRGGANGYHSSDPNWKEIPASKWGLEFVTQRFGSVLVISSKNEVGYIHHHYTLENVHLDVPANVTVVREPRPLSDDGAPNLKSP